jgi:hypothetical protein
MMSKPWLMSSSAFLGCRVRMARAAARSSPRIVPAASWSRSLASGAGCGAAAMASATACS